VLWHVDLFKLEGHTGRPTGTVARFTPVGTSQSEVRLVPAAFNHKFRSCLVTISSRGLGFWPTPSRSSVVPGLRLPRPPGWSLASTRRGLSLRLLSGHRRGSDPGPSDSEPPPSDFSRKFNLNLKPPGKQALPPCSPGGAGRPWRPWVPRADGGLIDFSGAAAARRWLRSPRGRGWQGGDSARRGGRPRATVRAATPQACPLRRSITAVTVVGSCHWYWSWGLSQWPSSSTKRTATAACQCA
jgi:hypothetical protein